MVGGDGIEPPTRGFFSSLTRFAKNKWNT